jgi:hypothetical protein
MSNLIQLRKINIKTYTMESKLMMMNSNSKGSSLLIIISWMKVRKRKMI